MSIFYIDLVNGNDANDGLGPYKAAFTSGGTYEIQVGDTVTDDTTAATAKVALVVVTSGSWAGGDAAGTLYVGTPSGAFTASGTISVGANANVATLTDDFAVSSWLTTESGATAARTAPGDTIRYKKHAAAASLGVNATFTNGSASLTLASALTAEIDNCESAWTQSANVTATADTTYKQQGSACAKLVFASGFATGKAAYFDFGEGNEKDLSAYQKVSFVMRVSADLAGSMFKICLCSDATGDVPVDELTITQALQADTIMGPWNRIVLDKGSALGSSIRSIAIYALSDPGTPTIYFDNIIACNALTHQTIIGKNDNIWLQSKKIDGTTIGLMGGLEYEGTSETVALYGINDFKTFEPAAQTTACISPQESGSSAGYITYSGGWDFSTITQDGYTHFLSLVGTCGHGWSTSNKHYLAYENFLMAGFSNGMNLVVAQPVRFKNLMFSGCYNRAISCDKSCEVVSVEGLMTAWGQTGPAFVFGCFRTITECPTDLEMHGGEGLYLLKEETVSGGFYMTGELKAPGCEPCLAGTVNSIFVRKITSDSLVIFGDDTLGDIEIGEIVSTATAGAGTALFVGIYDAQANIRIGKYTKANATATVTTFLVDSYTSRGGMGRVACDMYDGTAGRFVGRTYGGTFGDHVSMGQASGWAYGGSGNSLVFNPCFTDRTMRYKVYLPVTAAGTYNVTFQKIKSSSGANCTLTIDIFGCGITAVIDESVTLTDSWAKHTSANITVTETGWICLVFSAIDGSTTGDIGIDDIKLEAVA